MLFSSFHLYEIRLVMELPLPLSRSRHNYNMTSSIPKSSSLLTTAENWIDIFRDLIHAKMWRGVEW